MMTRVVTDDEVSLSFDQNTAVAAGMRIRYVRGGACPGCAANIAGGGCGLALTRMSLLCSSSRRKDKREGAWKEVT